MFSSVSVFYLLSAETLATTVWVKFTIYTFFYQPGIFDGFVFFLTIFHRRSGCFVFFSVQVMVPYYAAVGQLPAEESNWIGIAMVIIIVVYIYKFVLFYIIICVQYMFIVF